ncbi:MAG: LytTR family DNA-binding domain-containing protein [Parasphingorhabdus sp.]
MIDGIGISTLIVDDEPLARNRLKTLCSRLSDISHIRLASNGLEALRAIEVEIPDVILLDVDMPDISGIEVAEKCKLQEKKPEIIFTTAHSKYAVRAFRLHAADFLLKPVKESLLSEAVERVIEKLGKTEAINFGEVPKDAVLWVKDGEGSLQIRCSDIDHIVAEQDYMRLCLLDRSFLIHGTMQSLVKLLPQDMFVRIHRSTMVRRDCIKEIRRSGRRKYIVLQNGTDLTIGASFADGFFN